MTRTINVTALLLLALLYLFSPLNSNVANAEELGFLEEFVLAEDREKVLKKLVPGTEAYYYYYALHYQNNEQLGRVDELLKLWVKRSGETQRVQEIRNRQALLRYSDDPQATLAYLTEKLRLNFSHARRIPQAQRQLPTELDPEFISVENQIRSALGRTNLDRLTDVGLRKVAGKKLTKTQRRHLLSRLRQPDFPNLVELILSDLKEKDSKSFGNLQIHRALTNSQLDELVKSRPKLLTESGFVNIYLSKLHASEDVDWRADRAEHRAYLDRLWAFVGQLNPNFNSLKACVLFRQLELDRLEGKYDLVKFKRYLEFPRNIGYVNPSLVKRVSSRSHIVNMNANYRSQIMLLPIQNDEELVQDYLQHFLLNMNGFEEFTPYVRDEYLKRQFATVKILNGVGDPEAWASMLTPEQYKGLLDRSDVEFLSTNKEFFGVEDDVQLELYLKNVDNLIVRVFEINANNYYKKYGREIDTDINLDGLVPNHEESYQYDIAPALRKKRSFKFPQIKQRGVYVVDFIAGGKSSRALIRKGRLQVYDRVTSAGQIFTVVDQSGAVVTDGSLWVQGARYDALENGRILIPFSSQPGMTNFIISQGDFSSLQRVNHLPEQYEFKAALVLDRENLTTSNTGRILIRPSLKIVNGNPAPLSLLKDVKVTIASTDLDGVGSTKTVNDVELSNVKESVVEFVVPPRLKQIAVTLTANLKRVTDAQTQSFSQSQNYVVNEIDESESIQDLHLIPTSNGYFLEVLGKSGERRAGQAVRIGVRFVDVTTTVYRDLQSDENGLIKLGDLPGIFSIEGTVVDGKKKTWNLSIQDQTYYSSLHALQGQTIELPAPAGIAIADRDYISLIEKRSGTYTRDHFEKIKVVNGLISIDDLDAGDYELTLRYQDEIGGAETRVIRLRVTDGKEAGNVLVGKFRHLEQRDVNALHLSSVKLTPKSLKVQLENVSEATRIHVIANRYMPAFDAFQEFQQIRGVEPWLRRPSLRRTVYMEGRKIGEEYEYILRRKFAKRYPGNMLERPSLLLNPWSTRSTDNSSQVAAGGKDFSKAGNAADEDARRDQQRLNRRLQNYDFANLDYLDKGAVLLENLKPSKTGVVDVDLDKLKANQFVRLIVMDGDQTIQRTVDLPMQNFAPRDARLAHSLDPDKHFSQSKQTDIMKKGETLSIDDIISAKFQQYDELEDVYRLFLSLNRSANLSRFQFVLNWINLTEEEKQTLYSKHASHELNFFILKKDPEFFERVVIPHVKNKRAKTFMDHWLLGSNLDQYTNPWRYPQLNTVEKILLAKRMEDRTADMVRHINESYDLNPTPRKTSDRFYDSTIAGLGLSMSRPTSTIIGRDTNELPDLAGLPAPQSGAGFGAIGGRIAGGGGGAGGGLAMANEYKNSSGSELDDALVEFESINGVSRGRASRSKAKSLKKLAELDMVEKQIDKKAQLGQELRSRMVPVTRMRIESRTRRLADGRTETYQVQVPYTEQVAQNYSIPADGAIRYELLDEESELGLRELKERLYRRLDPTREYIENNYYRLRPDQQKAALVGINQFWRDYANHPGGDFLSPHFSEANRTFTEMMFALSVLDLPLKAPEHKFDYVDNSMKFTSAGPAIVFHQQVKDAVVERGNTTILVSENFFQKNDRYRYEDSVRFDKFVTGDFLAHTLYGGQVVITNPTSTPRAVDLLLQIPRGSVACSGSKATQTIQFNLAAFSTKTFEYSFYFPTAGDFGHYPAHVSSKEKVIAIADPVTFNVVDRPAAVDTKSWEFVSQNGSEQEVLDYLNRENVMRLDLEQIAFRMKDKSFYERAIATLQNRYVYNHTLWAYSVKHNDLSGMREYLVNSPIVSKVGKFFSSEVLSVDPVERNWYQHKEYWPLVNARAHQLGPKRKILNQVFFQQYTSLLNVLANRRELTSDDHLVITYYLLLQDRIELALEHFAKVKADSLESKIQYDYCDAYLDLYRENPDAAATKAQKWASYPVDHWRKRFENILAQVEEIRGGETKAIDEKETSQIQTELASKAESFDFDIEAGKAKIQFQNLTRLQANFYEMDIELLFSRSPFAQDELEGFSLIRPNFTQPIELSPGDNGKGSHTFELPAEMQNKNVLVELVAGDQTRSLPYFAHSLNVQTLERFGQIHVTDRESGKAIPKTYVKVYSKDYSGNVKFHKDGYTDLRGRFDYVSQSNHSIDGIKKFSILILSDEKGAVIRQANPPKE